MSSRNVVFTSIASLLLGACATDGPGDGSILEHLFARNGGEAPVQVSHSQSWGDPRSTPAGGDPHTEPDR